jgi:quercetin dioxygenase-like cupin family protein
MDRHQSKPLARMSSSVSVEGPKGIFRTTLAYNEQSMLCHFRLGKGARIPLHDHPAAQNGYLLSGRMRFLKEAGEAFVAEPGTGWCFDPGERHGAEVLEDSEAVECFAPMRPDYVP